MVNLTLSNRGVVLFSIVIILLVIGLIGATLVASYMAVDISNRLIADEAKAFYLAEAGISYAINMLRTQAGEAHSIEETIGPVSLGEGSFVVEIDYVQSLITSSGLVGDVEKKLQLKYTQL